MRTRQLRRIHYYKGAAEHWREAIRVQQKRCLESTKDSVLSRIDLNFYVVSVSRLREVARQAKDRLNLDLLNDAIERFDARWPRFKELRNEEEHITGPSGQMPLGVWYFQGSVADLKANGKVEYLVHIEKMESDIEKLYSAICEILNTELPES